MLRIKWDYACLAYIMFLINASYFFIVRIMHEDIELINLSELELNFTNIFSLLKQHNPR